MATFEKDKFSGLLKTKYVAKTLVYTDITGSTMDDARRLAHQVSEYPHGSAVLAERQTKARGARDHKWDASNTGNIYVSFILHLPPHYKTFEGRFDVEVAACLAVMQVARKFGVAAATPKWPNDVWVRGHKLSGNLVEDGRFNIPGSLNCLIILGMGINVNSDVRRNSELSGIATSLMCERGGRPVDREQFFAEVCAAVEQNLEQTRTVNLEIFRQENLFSTGQDISVFCPTEGRVIDAKFLEICDNWEVRFSDKTEKTFQGRSSEFTVRPKVLNKILVIFTTVPAARGFDDSKSGGSDIDGGSSSNTAASETDGAATQQGSVPRRSAQKLASMLQALVDTSRYVVCLVPESLVTDTDDWVKTCSLLVLPEPLANPGLVSSKLDTFLGNDGRVLASGMGSLFLAKSLHIPLKEVFLHPSSAHPEFCLVHVKANLPPPPPDPTLQVSAPTTTTEATSDISTGATETVGSACEDLRKVSLETSITYPSSNSMCFQFFEDEKAMLAESSAGFQDKKEETTVGFSGDDKHQIKKEGEDEEDIAPRSGESFSSPHNKTTVLASYDPTDGTTARPSVAACVVKPRVNTRSCAGLVGFDIGAGFPSSSLAGTSQTSEDAERFKREVFLQQIVDSLLNTP